MAAFAVNFSGNGGGNKGYVTGLALAMTFMMVFGALFLVYSITYLPHRDKERAMNEAMERAAKVAEAFVTYFGEFRDNNPYPIRRNQFPASFGVLLTRGYLTNRDLYDPWKHMFAVIVSYPFDTRAGGCPYPDEQQVASAGFTLSNMLVYPHVAVVSAGPNGVFDARYPVVLGYGRIVTVRQPLVNLDTSGTDDVVYILSTQEVVNSEVFDVRKRIQMIAQVLVDYWMARFRYCCVYKKTDNCPRSFSLPDDCMNPPPNNKWRGYFVPNDCKGAGEMCYPSYSTPYQYARFVLANNSSYTWNRLARDMAGNAFVYAGITDFRTVLLRVRCYPGRTSTPANVNIQIPTTAYEFAYK